MKSHEFFVNFLGGKQNLLGGKHTLLGSMQINPCIPVVPSLQRLCRLHVHILYYMYIYFKLLSSEKNQLIVELMDNANGSPQAQCMGVVWVEFVTIPII